MQSFSGYLEQRRLEPLMLEVSAGLAYLDLNPEEWLTAWVRENYPVLEDTAIYAFNNIALKEAWGAAPTTGPYPGSGGFLSGMKNFLGSLAGGAKQAWNAGKEAYQNFRGQKTEDAFANAFKYVNSLVDAMQQDPRVAQAMKDPASNGVLGKIHGALGQMRDQLTQLGKQVAPYLSGQPQPQAPNQGQPAPNQNQPVNATAPTGVYQTGDNQFHTGQAGEGPQVGRGTKTMNQTVNGQQNAVSQADAGMNAGNQNWQTSASTFDQPEASPQSSANTGFGKGNVQSQDVVGPQGPGNIRATTKNANTNATQVNTYDLPSGQDQAYAGMNGPYMGGPIDTGMGQPAGFQADTGVMQEPQPQQRLAKRSRKARPVHNTGQAVAGGIYPGAR